MHNIIPTEISVVITKSKFATKHKVQMIMDLYEIGVSISKQIVCQFIFTMKEIMLKINIKCPSSTMVKKHANEVYHFTTYHMLFAQYIN